VSAATPLVILTLVILSLVILSLVILTLVIVRNEATRDRFLAKAVQKPREESDPSLRSG
jgi:hypothetical protein